MSKIVALSLAQARLFFLDQTLPRKALFNIPIVVSLTGNLDIVFLQEAFQYLVERHEILRMTVQEVKGDLSGIISDNQVFNLNIVDLSQEQEALNKKKALNYIHGKILEDFDLSADALIKVHLIILNDKQFILAIILHHIIADEWSTNILLRDLSVFYNASKKHIKPKLPNLTIQYSDYALLQHNAIDIPPYDKALEYWRQHLNNAPEILSLPTDKPRPTELTYLGGNYKTKLPLENLLELRNYSRTKRVTMFTVLLTLFKCLLHRYTGENDIVIGYPSANRLQPEVENLIGLFVNIIPIRTLFQEKHIFEDLLEQTKINLINGYENQNFPFDQLVQILQVTRRQNFHPIFQVLFTLHGKYGNESNFEELHIESVELEEANLAKFDLSLFCAEEHDGLSLNFVYSKDLFKESTIKCLAKCFKHLLSYILKNNNIIIADIPLVTEKEKYKQLVLWNTTAHNFVYKNVTLHSLFVTQTNITPENIAIIFDNKTYTYKTLNILADQFATYLYNIDFKPGNIAAITLEPSLQLIVCILGLFKAGGIYLPLDAKYPEDRLTQILDDSKAKLLIINNNMLDKFQTYKDNVIVLDKEWDKILNQKTQEIHLENNAEIACIIYTSGSTGKAKGVLCKHSSIVNRIKWVWEHYPFNQNETCILLANISFIDSIAEIFIPLLRGIKLVVTPTHTAANPEILINYLTKYNVTRIGLVPTLLRTLLEKYSDLSLQLPYLTHWEISGEIFPNDLIITTLTNLKDITLINRYGSTEATSIIYNELSLSSGKDNEINIKTQVIANTQIYILDKYLQLLPVGLTGYIYVGGVPLAKGYLNSLQLTSEQFIENPYQHYYNGPIYKTGDLGYFSEDGTVNIIGRKDKLVKINGYRVELGEIESRIKKHELVKQCVVIAKQIDIDQKKLIAYITCKNANSIDKAGHNFNEELYSYLSKYLPEYMLPSSFVILEEFPLTRSNKIDYQLLHSQQELASLQNKQYVAPRNHKEYKMAKIWEQVLKLERVGIHDNFFKIGGNSLIAIRLIVTIQQEFSTKFPTAHIYKYPTIATIAKVLQDDMAISTLVKALQDDVSNLHFNIVLPIQTKGTGSPLFLIHPSPGVAFPYSILSHFIDEYPIYGINDPWLTDSANAFKSIEEMAQYYIQTIQTIQKNGPYKLGGWSFGGLVALEMARQLQNDKHQVDIVIFFDTSNYPKSSLTNSLEDELNEILVRIGVDPSLNEALILKNELKNSAILLKNYYPPIYQGRVILIKAQDDEFITEFRTNDIYQGWQDVLGRHLEIYSTPGSHREMFNSENIVNIVKIIKYVLSNPNSGAILQDKNLQLNNAYLHHVVEVNDTFMIKRLIKMGANPLSRDSNGKTAYDKSNVTMVI